MNNQISNRANNFLSVVLFLLCCIIISCYILQNKNLASLFFTFSFIVLLLLWARNIQLNTVTGKLVVFIVLLALFNVSLNSFLNSTSISFEYYKKTILFCCSIVFFSVASEIHISSYTSKLIYLLNIILSSFILYSFYKYGDLMYIRDGVVTEYLTMNMDNSNMAGLFLFCVAVINYLACLFFQKKVMKIISIVFFCAISWLIILTFTRNCIIALSVFLLLQIYIIINKRSTFSLPRILYKFAAIWPFVFALLYMSIIQTDVVASYLADFAGEGKSLDSRIVVWSNSFNAWWNHPILGAYSEISNGTGWTQCHNTHVDILCSYGLPVLILVCCFLYSVMKKVGDRVQNKYQLLCLTGFVSLLFLGMGEAALFVGASGIYILGGTLLLLANGQEQIKYYDKKNTNNFQ